MEGNVVVIGDGMGGVADQMEIMISEDGMKAFLKLKSGVSLSGYTFEEIKCNLAAAGLQAAIKEDVLSHMLEDELFDEYYLIAEGELPTHGQDGYYEYFFDTNAQTGIPRILPDGRVDYSQIIELVKKGDVVAEYHRSENGENGYKVTGEILKPSEVRDEPILHSSGVEREGERYKALFDGRVTLKNSYLEVDPALRIKGDVNQAYGDVCFNGDVFVEGDIRSGMTVEATGAIVVDGSVEGAHLIAGNDIIIAYGVHGEGKALLELNGELACNYIEGAVIVAKGKITAGSMIHSDVHSDQSVDVTAEDKGIIMGGIVCGMTGVRANILGHRSGVLTQIYAGASKQDTDLLHKLQRSVRSSKDYLERIDSEKEELTGRLEKAGNTVEGERIKKRLKLIADEKFQLDIKLNKSNWELDRLSKKLAQTAEATIVVNYHIYEGVEMILGTIEAQLPQDIEGAKLVKNGNEVEVNPFVKARRKKQKRGK